MRDRIAAGIILLSGERGAGKSTVCHKTVTLARAQGYTCGGVITLNYANYADDVRDVLDAGSGQMRRLTVDTASAVVMGRFRFDPQTMIWGNDVLAHAAPCHLLVVDELGPLEVERGQGWQKAFEVLRGGDFGLALVVVRPGLLEQVRHKLPAGSTETLTVETGNRDDLPRVILEMLGSDALSQVRCS